MTIEMMLAILCVLGAVCWLIPARLADAVRAAGIIGGVSALVMSAFPLACGVFPSLTPLFAFDALRGMVALGCGFFCCASTVYAAGALKIGDRPGPLLAGIIWCAAFSMGAVLSENLIVLVVFWGLSGLMVYVLAAAYPAAAGAAKKSFVFLGGSDALMILGLAVVALAAGTLDIGLIRVPLSGAPVIVIVAFVLLLTAALAKAGAVPLHSWIPDFSEKTPALLSAYLPASLDKLLGIYLFAVVVTRMFVVTPAVSLSLCALGALTIIAAVFMALVQHDLKRLLAYHAVSQVGYMVLGIASGSPLGLAAGLFHMINHTLYKSALFFTADTVERRTGTTDLDRLGGLAREMPIAFAVCLIASLSIAGIPPFNGFASKLMLFQALVERVAQAGGASGALYALFLVVALFGSALTLASFIKVLHAVFLGQPSELRQPTMHRLRDVSPLMAVPMLIIAGLCLLFGLMPSLALDHLIMPARAVLDWPVLRVDVWSGGLGMALTAGFLVAGAAAGLIALLPRRSSHPFTGGEALPAEARAAASEFYLSVSSMRFIKRVYVWADRGWFDVYERGTSGALRVGKALSQLHGGRLQAYLGLFAFAMVMLLLAVMR